MKNAKDYTVAVLGTQNAVGQAILAELELQNYPIELVHPLDLHQESGGHILYQNQLLTSFALDLFDMTQPHILFLCEPRIFERYPHHFLHGKNWIIDCTGRLHKAPCIIPSLNPQNILCAGHKCLCAPNSATIALASVLHPLYEKYGVASAEATAILGAWYPQPNLADKLIYQTRQCFAQTSSVSFSPTLAFNLIPEFFHKLIPLIQHQLHCFVSCPVQIHSCFAPVLRGGVFFVQIVLHKTARLSGIRAIFQNNSLCQILETPQTIGTHDLVVEDKLYLQNLTLSHNKLSFWLMQDPVQSGFIQNAVKIMTLLQK